MARSGDAPSGARAIHTRDLILRTRFLVVTRFVASPRTSASSRRRKIVARLGREFFDARLADWLGDDVETATRRGDGTLSGDTTDVARRRIRETSRARGRVQAHVPRNSSRCVTFPFCTLARTAQLPSLAATPTRFRDFSLTHVSRPSPVPSQSPARCADPRARALGAASRPRSSPASCRAPRRWFPSTTSATSRV